MPATLSTDHELSDLDEVFTAGHEVLVRPFIMIIMSSKFRCTLCFSTSGQWKKTSRL